MNMNTKMIIGGAAVLAAGATTYVVVKNVKKKKAENKVAKKSQLISANKATELIEAKSVVKDEEKKADKEVVVEKKEVEKSSEVSNNNKKSETVVETSDKKEKVSEEKSSTDECTEDKKEAETSKKKDKNKLNLNDLFIKKIDDEGKERAVDDKLNNDEIATIQAYAELIKEIKSEKDVNKFIEENSTFEKFETYNSELLKHFVDNFVGAKRMTEIEEVMAYVKENIILTNSEDDVMLFNRIYDLFNKLKANKDIYFVYAQDLITNIVKVLVKLRDLVDEVIDNQKDTEEENEDYGTEEEMIESVLRARVDDEDEYIKRPAFGDMGLEINNGDDEPEDDSYEDDTEYLTSAKKEFLINTRFHYDD